MAANEAPMWLVSYLRKAIRGLKNVQVSLYERAVDLTTALDELVSDSLETQARRYRRSPRATGTGGVPPGIEERYGTEGESTSLSAAPENEQGDTDVEVSPTMEFAIALVSFTLFLYVTVTFLRRRRRQLQRSKQNSTVPEMRIRPSGASFAIPVYFRPQMDAEKPEDNAHLSAAAGDAIGLDKELATAKDTGQEVDVTEGKPHPSKYPGGSTTFEAARRELSKRSGGQPKQPGILGLHPVLGAEATGARGTEKSSGKNLSRLMVGPPGNCTSMTGELLVYAVDLPDMPDEESPQPGAALNPSGGTSAAGKPRRLSPQRHIPHATITSSQDNRRSRETATTAGAKSNPSGQILESRSGHPRLLQRPPQIKFVHDTTRQVPPFTGQMPGYLRTTAAAASKVVDSKAGATENKSLPRKTGRRARSVSPEIQQEEYGGQKPRWKSSPCKQQNQRPGRPHYSLMGSSGQTQAIQSKTQPEPEEHAGRWAGGLPKERISEIRQRAKRTENSSSEKTYRFGVTGPLEGRSYQYPKCAAKTKGPILEPASTKTYRDNLTSTKRRGAKAEKVDTFVRQPKIVSKKHDSGDDRRNKVSTAVISDGRPRFKTDWPAFFSSVAAKHPKKRKAHKKSSKRNNLKFSSMEEAAFSEPKPELTNVFNVFGDSTLFPIKPLASPGNYDGETTFGLKKTVTPNLSSLCGKGAFRTYQPPDPPPLKIQTSFSRVSENHEMSSYQTQKALVGSEIFDDDYEEEVVIPEESVEGPELQGNQARHNTRFLNTSATEPPSSSNDCTLTSQQNVTATHHGHWNSKNVANSKGDIAHFIASNLNADNSLVKTNSSEISGENDTALKRSFMVLSESNTRTEEDSDNKTNCFDHESVSPSSSEATQTFASTRLKGSAHRNPPCAHGMKGQQSHRRSTICQSRCRSETKTEFSNIHKASPLQFEMPMQEPLLSDIVQTLHPTFRQASAFCGKKAGMGAYLEYAGQLDSKIEPHSETSTRRENINIKSGLSTAGSKGLSKLKGNTVFHITRNRVTTLKTQKGQSSNLSTNPGHITRKQLYQQQTSTMKKRIKMPRTQTSGSFCIPQYIYLQKSETETKNYHEHSHLRKCQMDVFNHKDGINDSKGNHKHKVKDKGPSNTPKELAMEMNGPYDNIREMFSVNGDTPRAASGSKKGNTVSISANQTLIENFERRTKENSHQRTDSHCKGYIDTKAERFRNGSAISNQKHNVPFSFTTEHNNMKTNALPPRLYLKSQDEYSYSASKQHISKFECDSATSRSQESSSNYSIQSFRDCPRSEKTTHQILINNPPRKLEAKKSKSLLSISDLKTKLSNSKKFRLTNQSLCVPSKCRVRSVQKVTGNRSRDAFQEPSIRHRKQAQEHTSKNYKSKNFKRSFIKDCSSQNSSLSGHSWKSSTHNKDGNYKNRYARYRKFMETRSRSHESYHKPIPCRAVKHSKQSGSSQAAHHVRDRNNCSPLRRSQFCAPLLGNLLTSCSGESLSPLSEPGFKKAQAWSEGVMFRCNSFDMESEHCSGMPHSKYTSSAKPGIFKELNYLHSGVNFDRPNAKSKNNRTPHSAGQAQTADQPSIQSYTISTPNHRSLSGHNQEHTSIANNPTKWEHNTAEISGLLRRSNLCDNNQNEQIMGMEDLQVENSREEVSFISPPTTKSHMTQTDTSGMVSLSVAIQTSPGMIPRQYSGQITRHRCRSSHLIQELFKHRAKEMRLERATRYRRRAPRMRTYSNISHRPYMVLNEPNEKVMMSSSVFGGYTKIQPASKAAMKNPSASLAQKSCCTQTISPEKSAEIFNQNNASKTNASNLANEIITPQREGMFNFSNLYTSLLNTDSLVDTRDDENPTSKCLGKHGYNLKHMTDKKQNFEAPNNSKIISEEANSGETQSDQRQTVKEGEQEKNSSTTTVNRHNMCLIRPLWKNVNIEEVDRRVKRALRLRRELQLSRASNAGRRDTLKLATDAVSASETGQSRALHQMHGEDKMSINATETGIPKNTNLVEPFSHDHGLTQKGHASVEHEKESSGHESHFQFTKFKGKFHRFLPDNQSTNQEKSSQSAIRTDVILPIHQSSGATIEHSLSAHDLGMSADTTIEVQQRPSSANIASGKSQGDNSNGLKRSNVGARNKNSPPTKISKRENQSLSDSNPRLVGSLVQYLPQVPLSSFVEWFIETSDPKNFVASEKSKMSSPQESRTSSDEKKSEFMSGEKVFHSVYCNESAMTSSVPAGHWLPQPHSHLVRGAASSTTDGSSAVTPTNTMNALNFSAEKSSKSGVFLQGNVHRNSPYYFYSCTMDSSNYLENDSNRKCRTGCKPVPDLVSNRKGTTFSNLTATNNRAFAGVSEHNRLGRKTQSPGRRSSSSTPSQKHHKGLDVLTKTRHQSRAVDVNTEEFSNSANNSHTYTYEENSANIADSIDTNHLYLEVPLRSTTTEGTSENISNDYNYTKQTKSQADRKTKHSTTRYDRSHSNGATLFPSLSSKKAANRHCVEGRRSRNANSSNLQAHGNLRNMKKESVKGQYPARDLVELKSQNPSAMDERCAPGIRNILMKLQHSEVTSSQDINQQNRVRITLRRSSDVSGIIAKFQDKTNNNPGIVCPHVDDDCSRSGESTPVCTLKNDIHTQNTSMS